MKKLIVATFIMYCLFSCCEFAPYLNWKNNSSDSICLYIAWGGMDPGANVYPDTTLPAKPHLRLLKPHSQGVYGPLPVYDLAEMFEKYVHSDTLSVFFIDAKIVENKPWEDIRKNYLIKMRYELDKEHIYRCQNLDIEYPPTSKMPIVKIFQPLDAIKNDSIKNY